MSEINVTPTEDLVMEVLAARVRGGESCWTFENTHLRALRALQAKGLLHFDSAPTPKARRAYLTDLGRETYLFSGYTEPVTHLREQLVEQEARIETAAATRRVVAERISRTEAEMSISAQAALIRPPDRVGRRYFLRPRLASIPAPIARPRPTPSPMLSRATPRATPMQRPLAIPVPRCDPRASRADGSSGCDEVAIPPP